MIGVEVVSFESRQPYPSAFIVSGFKAALAAGLLFLLPGSWAASPSQPTGAADYEDFVLTGQSFRRKAALSSLDVDEHFTGGSPSVIDVMVLYTPLAKLAYGRTAIETRVALGVAYLNEAFNRSGVRARVRAIQCVEATWHCETPWASDELYWLSGDSTVAELREQVGADLVSLLVRDGLPNGGMAHLPGSFSVFNGNPHLFAHECGHNFGCGHERAHAGYAAGSEGCGFGYVFTPPGTPFRYGDIMSYEGSQYQQFSNPTRFFRGAPTGLPEGHVDPLGIPDGADNALTLNRTVAYVAGTRWPQVPLLSEPLLSEDGSEFSFLVTGSETGVCTVEHTPDLRQWTRVTECVLTGDSLEIKDHVAGVERRFYRARMAKGTLPTQVGFVRQVIRQGFSMIANPVEKRGNTIAEVLPNVPEGTQVYRWVEGRQTWECASFDLGEWDQPGMTLHPGEGVIVKNPSESFPVYFVGELNTAMHSRVPTQLSIRSSSVPRAGRLSSELGYVPFGPGGQVFRMDDGRYKVWVWDGASWSPEEPVIEVGEAIWCKNPINSVTWIQPPES